jgi:hypothetical protein
MLYENIDKIISKMLVERGRVSIVRTPLGAIKAQHAAIGQQNCRKFFRNNSKFSKKDIDEANRV